ncbi:MAG TPA: hypothetical protein PK572_09565 [Kiritimatiellia bacterium]|nr:hypothetical protein [Kiritimatiellia bacterium]
MRTIEEITKDLSENNGMLLIQSVLTKEDKIRCLLKKIDLGNELIAAQDAEIARLRQQLGWQPIETAPEQEEILGLAKNGHVYEITVDDGNFDLSSFWPDDEWDCDFTHWIPIPPLTQPKEASHAND